MLLYEYFTAAWIECNMNHRPLEKINSLITYTAYFQEIQWETIKWISMKYDEQSELNDNKKIIWN